MNLKPIRGTGVYAIKEYKMQSGELCVNGNFSSGAGWFGYTDPGMSISGGTLNFNNAANGLGAYRIMASVGKRYIISYNVVECTLGGFHIRNGNEYESIVRSTVGRYTEYITARTSGFIGIAANGTTTGRVDNVSFTEVLPLPSFKTNQRYLQCDVAGTIAFNSQQAFGVWEWDWYKGADGNILRVQFINTTLQIDSSENGYRASASGIEQLSFVKDSSGTAALLIQTNASYIQNNTWYRIRITRTLTGSFTLLIKGGNFTPTAGYDGWTLVSTTGGSGTNPVVDLSYVTSNFCVFDLDQGDRVTNIIFSDGIKQ